jgi:polyhydroxybutyrate depolymerase
MRMVVRALPFLFIAACSHDSESRGPAPADAGGSTADGSDDAGESDAGPSSPDTGNDDDASRGDDADAGPIGGNRPVSVHVPPGYVPGTPAPLVVMLHGYSASGAVEESYLNITAQSDARGFLYAYPDGTVDARGLRFWNATDACCNWANAMVDDAEYLSSLITEIEARYSVDPKRVFLVGHSNGGFMAYRMACDHADQIAAIASLAGAMFADVTKCAPKAPVSVLQIHGTADTVIDYMGGMNQGHAYPDAPTTVADWATLNGCAMPPDTSAPHLDLDASLVGDETSVTRYAGCEPGGQAELWTIQGGAHIPALSPTFSSSVVDFLLSHARP